MIGTNVDRATSSSRVRWFEELDRTSLAEAGGKGANLGELVRAGLPVPPGFVVTADAYSTHLRSSGLRERIAGRLRSIDARELSSVSAASRDIMSWIEDSPIPDSVIEEVVHAYYELAGRLSSSGPKDPAPRVAVRSSATAEDLPSASFAGQQESFLGVAGQEAVLRAVRRCWASLWTPQAISYRASMGFDQLEVELAVVVQAMVPADVAGVMFTANPVTGALDEILVSATYGLGESVVSGTVTPDTFVLLPDGSVGQRTMGSKERRLLQNGVGTKVEEVPAADRARYSIGDAELAGLAALARRVQEHYGAPQDTEWALHGSDLFLLQARPITTLGNGNRRPGGGVVARVTSNVPLPDEQPINRKMMGASYTVEYWAEPPTPLDSSFFCLSNSGMNSVFEEIGLNVRSARTETVERPDGRIAIRSGSPSLSPAMLWRIPARLIANFRKDPIEGWNVVADDMKDARRRWMAAEEESRSGADLARLVEREMKEFAQLVNRRFSAVFLIGIQYMLLLKLFTRLAGGKAEAAVLDDRLMRAIPFRTALQNQAVVRLAQLASNYGKDSAEFGDALEQYMDEWGSRPVHGMVVMPSSATLRENPSQVMSLVDALLSSPGGSSADEELRRERSDYESAREQVAGSLWGPLRGIYRATLHRTRNGTLAREDSQYHMETLMAGIRHTTLRLGQQLVKERIVEDADDVFFLLSGELVAVAEGRLDVADRIERRKRAFDRVLQAHQRGQHWLVATGSVLESAIKGKEPPARRLEAGDRPAIQGMAASGGQVVGPVSVVHGPEEFGKLRKGDVLVAPFTVPVWTPLFRIASAVVTDIGNPTSHAAIVAREYGIPAVVATGNGTSLLSDGLRVQVDGTRGVVTLLADSDR